MPLNLASPGIVVREVDLTVGRANATSSLTAGIVAPFEKGPVNAPILVQTEQDLIKIFGPPLSVDNQYESWYVASSFLSYGGSLRVIRSDDADLKNSVYPASATAIKITNDENYVQLGYSQNIISNIGIIARNPGSWANDLKIAIIDGKADQIIGIGTTNIGGSAFAVGMGVTQAISSTVAGVGTTSALNGYLKGIITEVGSGYIGVKVLNYVSSGIGSTSIDVNYVPGGTYQFSSGSLGFTTSGQSVAFGSTLATSISDWYDQQYIDLSNGTKIYWNTVADRPSTSTYSSSRLGRFDELHILVLDDTGAITGNVGNIIEKHLNLSKATDAEYSLGSPSYWRRYLELNSDYIFGGSGAALGITTTSYTTSTGFTLSNSSWDRAAAGTIFGACGAISARLSGGLNYNGSSGITTSGALSSSISDICSGYDILANGEDYKIDFLLMGSGNLSKPNAQSLANKLIQVAENRKDSVAFISPYRQIFLNDTVPGTVTVNSTSVITDSLISYYGDITSSSYAVFDSTYKYVYDKYNDGFRYIPLNGDIAGLCVRNDLNNFPWFSPAGTSRGTIQNVIKLAYNPSRSERDRLYSNRINPIVFSPGSGVVLFGDRTALNKPSAFDRINVRRLFIYLQNVISEVAKDQLFEFNDEITRTNFLNIVEPFLRDIQAKRGIYDFRVICDETNNTASVIDNNEFIADIYVKPTRSINFVGLTFVATRTGVNFEEIIGTV